MILMVIEADPDVEVLNEVASKKLLLYLGYR
jgi:hypothetical protein